MKGEIKLFIEIDGNIYNSINISSVREVEETVDSSTVYKVITVFKNGRQIIEEYDNKSDADDELEKIKLAGPSGGGGDMSNYYTKSETEQLDTQTLNNAKDYTDEKVVNTVPTVTAMPNASSTYNGKVYQYIGTTDSNYTNGYFYICNNSGGSYAWHQLNVQPSGSQVPIYNYVSGSSSTDYGTSTSSSAVNGRIDLSSLAKGLHVFQNYSTGTGLNFKYMKTGASSYTNGSLNSYNEPITNSTSYYKTFTIEVIEDMSSGLDSYAANTTLAIVTFYESSNNYSWKYKLSVNTSSSSKSVQTYIIEKNANTLYMKSAYTTANSASSTANQAAQQASTNASAITALDTRVAALEQGGGGGSSQTEYISDGGGTSYPPSGMWSTSTGNYFTFAKSTAEFKEVTGEYIYVTLIPDQMYSDKINVNMNYNYATAMPDTSDVVIPNVTFKIYSTADDSELSSINVGDVTLTYDSMSNKWVFDKYGVSFTYIMSGQNVYCKMFYGGSGESSVIDASNYISVSGSSAEFKYDLIKTDIKEKGFMQMYYTPSSLEWSMFYSGTNYDGATIPLYGSCGFYVEAFIGNRMSGTDTFELVLLVHPNNNTVYKITVASSNMVNVYYLSFQSVV